MIAGSSRSLRPSTRHWSLRPKDPRDHGSTGGGAWRARSEAAPSAAAARPRPARIRDITAFGGTDRANRPPKRPKVVISRHDHGSGGGGGWRDKSENSGVADQTSRLVIEWTATVSQPTPPH